MKASDQIFKQIIDEILSANSEDISPLLLQRFLNIFNHFSRVYWVERNIKLKKEFNHIIDRNIDNKPLEDKLKGQISILDKIISFKDTKPNSDEDILTLIKYINDYLKNGVNATEDEEFDWCDINKDHLLDESEIEELFGNDSESLNKEEL